MSLTWFPAPAKINLFLHVTGRRADGYHELQTVFQLIDLCDQVGLKVRDDGVIQALHRLPGLDPEHDLSVRAARALQQATGCTLGCDIELQKHVPAGAGLGGGSSDAATVLCALNALWGTKLNETELAAIGLKLGADVPVFVHGHSAFAEGVGEALQPLELGPACYALVFPGETVPTAEIFRDPELTRNTPPIKISLLREGVSTHNDLQAVATRHYPEIGAAIDWLKSFGDARMSGSGSSVFVRVDSQTTAEAIKAEAPSRWRTWCVRGIDQSPLHLALRNLSAR